MCSTCTCTLKITMLYLTEVINITKEMGRLHCRICQNVNVSIFVHVLSNRGKECSAPKGHRPLISHPTSPVFIVGTAQLFIKASFCRLLTYTLPSCLNNVKRDSSDHNTTDQSTTVQFAWARANCNRFLRCCAVNMSFFLATWADGPTSFSLLLIVVFEAVTL